MLRLNTACASLASRQQLKRAHRKARRRGSARKKFSRTARSLACLLAHAECNRNKIGYAFLAPTASETRPCLPCRAVPGGKVRVGRHPTSSPSPGDSPSVGCRCAAAPGGIMNIFDTAMAGPSGRNGVCLFRQLAELPRSLRRGLTRLPGVPMCGVLTYPHLGLFLTRLHSDQVNLTTRCGD